MPYSQFDHTADIGLEAWGKDLEEAFREAARGMFDVITDVNTIEARSSVEVKVTGDSLEMLLVDFLSELVFLFEVRGMVFGEFDVTIEGLTLTAVCRGEPLDMEKHPQGSAVKAVSYHDISVEREGRIRVILDV